MIVQSSNRSNKLLPLHRHQWNPLVATFPYKQEGISEIHLRTGWHEGGSCNEEWLSTTNQVMNLEGSKSKELKMNILPNSSQIHLGVPSQQNMPLLEDFPFPSSTRIQNCFHQIRCPYLFHQNPTTDTWMNEYVMCGIHIVTWSPAGKQISAEV
jgi:hypothetical protein